MVFVWLALPVTIPQRRRTLSKAYKQAGVNLQAGYETVARLRRHVKRTERKGVSGDLGGFGGLLIWVAWATKTLFWFQVRMVSELN